MTKLESLNFDTVRSAHPERFNRSDLAATQVLETDPGNFVVKHPDSDDAHHAELADSPAGYFGTCGCKGYEHHTGPCSHLCAILRASEQGLLSIPLLEIHTAAGDIRDADECRSVESLPLSTLQTHSGPDHARGPGRE